MQVDGYVVVGEVVQGDYRERDGYRSLASPGLF